jgi:uncharacterized protein (DUF58 family)
MLNNFLKKLGLFLLVLAANFLISLRTEIGFFYWFFLFLSAILILSLFWVAVEYFGVKIRLERIVAGKVDSGDTLRVKAVLRNTGFLPVINLLLEDQLSCAPEGAKQARALIEYLGPGKTINVEYSCLCPRRGKYKLGPFRMYFFDPLGLFFLKRTCRDYAEIYVYPKTFPIHKFPALAKGIVPWFGIDTSRSSGDDDEFFGVREYRLGDPIKRIHWFSTALKNRLIVKQFQRQVFSRATIMFSLHRDKDYGDGDDSTGEYTVKIAASVARHLIEQGVSLEIIAHAGEMVHMPFNKGEEHLDDILKFLSIARSQSDIGLREIFEEFSRHIPDHTSVVVIMLDRDWDILPAMLPLEKRNISLIPLVLISSTFKYSLNTPEMVKDVKIKLSQAFNFTPVFFSRKDNPEEAFLH